MMYTMAVSSIFFFFFFNDTATTEIYTLSLHDALPISPWAFHLVASLDSFTQWLPGFVSPILCTYVHHNSPPASPSPLPRRSEEHTSELQSRLHLVCRLLLEKKKKQQQHPPHQPQVLQH